MVRLPALGVLVISNVEQVLLLLVDQLVNTSQIHVAFVLEVTSLFLGNQCTQSHVLSCKVKVDLARQLKMLCFVLIWKLQV